MRSKRKQQQQQQQQQQKGTQKPARPIVQDNLDSPPVSPTSTLIPQVSLPPLEKINFDNRIKRKNVLALNEKVAAIREYEKTPIYKHVGRMFNCSPDQIKRIVQQRDAILGAWEQRTRRCQDSRTLQLKTVRVSMLGKAVYEWIRRLMYYKDIIITDGLIQKMALQFKSAMGLPNFFPHQDWCDKFRQTYCITHKDTKLLKIGYTQGYSVQIKDIIKDVLTECTPETTAAATTTTTTDTVDVDCDVDIGDDEAEDVDNEDDYDEDDYDDDDEVDDDDNLDDLSDSNQASHTDDTDAEHKEDADVDIDGAGLPEEEREIKPTLTPTTTTTIAATTNTNQTTPTSLTTLAQMPANMLPTALQPLRQLLALPFKTNGPPGSVQKVLVATPISLPKQTRCDGAATAAAMTIIPFATLAQSVVQQQQQQQQKLKTAAEKPTQTVPAPILTIKKEIKEEPKDPNDEVTQAAAAASVSAEQQANVFIKQEILSEDEYADEPATTSTAATITNTGTTAAMEATKIQTNQIDATATPMTTVSLVDVLASLQAAAAATTTTATTNTEFLPETTNTPTLTSKSITDTLNLSLPTISATNNLKRASSNVPQKTTTTRNAKKRKLQRRKVAATQQNSSSSSNISHNNNNNEKSKQQPPAISSCAEARKYLKLLEEFALYKENFRLIGLITRADEVLRELDENRNARGMN